MSADVVAQREKQRDPAYVVQCEREARQGADSAHADQAVGLAGLELFPLGDSRSLERGAEFGRHAGEIGPRPRSSTLITSTFSPSTA
ncbi:hypothetical protein [Streptomyces sp. NPDC002265]|uniref:hypothetical protein n=1 Tax=Streptomyces sp. NPDC002265 TaxID=3154415 RepID=UPI003318E211